MSPIEIYNSYPTLVQLHYFLTQFIKWIQNSDSFNCFIYAHLE